jgi:ABC-type polysaccharide/polyol phosphate export permease
MSDFRQGFANWSFAALLAWENLFSRVRFTSLGILWLVIQPLIWVLAMVVLIQPSIAQQAQIYPAYVASGVVLFTGLTSLLGGGAQTFTREKGRIQNVPLPLSLFVLKTLLLAVLEMLVAVPIVIGAMLYCDIEFDALTLHVLPGLMLLFTFGFGAILILGTAAARYPSIVLATQSLLRVLLFVTPVFWMPTATYDLRFIIAHYNPLFHLIRVVRDPLLGLSPGIFSYLVASATSSIVLIAGIFVFARYRGRIAIWL